MFRHPRRVDRRRCGIIDRIAHGRHCTAGCPRRSALPHCPTSPSISGHANEADRAGCPTPAGPYIVHHPMRRYAFTQTTIQSYEQHDLTLADDGTFEYGVAHSDPAGAAGSSETTGRWTQSGDTITFET